MRIIAQTRVCSVRTTRYGEELVVKKRHKRGVVRCRERGGTKKEEEGKTRIGCSYERGVACEFNREAVKRGKVYFGG